MPNGQHNSDRNDDADYDVLYVHSSRILEEAAYLVDGHRGKPRQQGGVEGGESSPAPAAGLVFDAYAGRQARHIEQHEDKKRKSRERGHAAGAYIAMVEHRHSACHNLFSAYARQYSHALLPLQAAGGDKRLYSLAELADIAAS